MLSPARPSGPPGVFGWLDLLGVSPYPYGLPSDQAGNLSRIVEPGAGPVNPGRQKRGTEVGSVVKKRRKKMRKHKQRKLLKKQRHKK